MSELTRGQIQEITAIVDQVVSRNLNATNTNRTNNTQAAGTGPRWDVGINNFLNSAGKMTLGMYDASDAIGDFDKIIKGFGPDSPFKNIVGGIITTVGQTGLAMNRSMMDSAKSGFSFYQNLGLYDEAVLSARMSLRDWNNLVRESGTQLVGLSADANRSGLAYLAVAKELQEDVGTRKAIIAGVGTIEEYNNALRMVSQATKFQNLSQAQTTKEMADSAKGLVFELDMMARLTGKSRERMAKDIEEQNATAQMRLRIAAMTKEEHDAYLKNQVVVQGLPKAAQELLTAYQTGGLRNARDRDNAAAFTGTNIEAIIKQVAAIKTDTPEAQDQRRQLLAQMQQELVTIGANKKQLEQMSVLAGTDNQFAQKMGGVYADLAELSAGATKRQEEALERGETMSAYITKLYDEAMARITRVGATPTTPEEKNAQASQALNAFEQKIKDLQAGSAVLFTDNLNTAVGKLVTNFGGLEDATRPFTTEMFKNIGPNLQNFFKGLGYTGETITPQDRTNPMRVRRQQQLDPNSPVIEQQQTQPGTNPQPEGRGSKDVWGDWFGGKAGFTLIREQGPEAVVPQEKIGEFVKDMIAKTPSLLSDLQGNLKSTLSEARSSMPTTDTFKDMFSNIKFPEIPNTSDGTSTTSSNPFASSSQNSEVMTELARGINQLNMRVERLITAVEDGADKNVRATKTKGNVLA